MGVLVGGANSERLRPERDFGLRLSFYRTQVPPTSCDLLREYQSQTLFSPVTDICKTSMLKWTRASLDVGTLNHLKIVAFVCMFVCLSFVCLFVCLFVKPLIWEDRIVVLFFCFDWQLVLDSILKSSLVFFQLS